VTDDLQHVKSPLGSHVILVGLPGAGKSTLGPLVARAVDCPFVDLDVDIERAAGERVRDIFARGGESAFRAWERERTLALQSAPSSIVAPGGGWITQPDVVALLRPPSRILYLRVSPAAALARLGNEVQSRPLLSGEDPLSALVFLERERGRAYDQADAVLDTESLTLQELVSRATALASSWGVGVG
jgi:shikimate kinase